MWTFSTAFLCEHLLYISKLSFPPKLYIYTCIYFLSLPEGPERR